MPGRINLEGLFNFYKEQYKIEFTETNAGLNVINGDFTASYTINDYYENLLDFTGKKEEILVDDEELLKLAEPDRIKVRKALCMRGKSAANYLERAIKNFLIRKALKQYAEELGKHLSELTEQEVFQSNGLAVFPITLLFPIPIYDTEKDEYVKPIPKIRIHRLYSGKINFERLVESNLIDENNKKELEQTIDRYFIDNLRLSETFRKTATKIRLKLLEEREGGYGKEIEE